MLRVDGLFGLDPVHNLRSAPRPRRERRPRRAGPRLVRLHARENPFAAFALGIVRRDVAVEERHRRVAAAHYLLRRPEAAFLLALRVDGIDAAVRFRTSVADENEGGRRLRGFRDERRRAERQPPARPRVGYVHEFPHGFPVHRLAFVGDFEAYPRAVVRRRRPHPVFLAHEDAVKFLAALFPCGGTGGRRHKQIGDVRRRWRTVFPRHAV